jgi:hypothetical protein
MSTSLKLALELATKVTGREELGRQGECMNGF